MKDWKSFRELFEKLNIECRYLVLRNYRDIKDGVKEEGPHSDIDFLCDNRDFFINICGSEPRKSVRDKIHHKIAVGGTVIPVDIRYVGDGYYDKVWETDMLDKRILFEDRMYIPDPVNEKYSLIYHVLIQKKNVSPDYAVILEKMSGRNAFDEKSELEDLILFMRRQGYRFPFPVYPGGIFNRKKCPGDMISYDPIRMIRRLIYGIAKKVK